MVSLQALPQTVFPDEFSLVRRPTMGGSGPGLAGANIWKKLGFVVSESDTALSASGQLKRKPYIQTCNNRLRSQSVAGTTKCNVFVPKPLSMFYTNHQRGNSLYKEGPSGMACVGDGTGVSCAFCVLK